MNTAARDLRVFQGWYVVAAAFVITFVGFGCAYTFSAFIGPLQKEFGASRGSVSLAFSLAGFLYFALGIVSGPLADRWCARRLAAVGMLLTGAGLAWAGRASSLTEVYVAYAGGVGLGVGTAYVPTLGAVQRWFNKRRAMASGLAVAGIGVGTLVVPALASLLIAQVGWRDAYVVLGALAAVVGAVAALALDDSPQDRGLAPDGEPSTAGTAIHPHGASVRVAVQSREFAVLYASGLLCAVGAFVPFVHLVPYATDHGVSAVAAAALISTIGIGSTAGRFLLGNFADRVGREAALSAMIAGMGVSLVVWLFASGLWGLMIFALIFGVFYGGWVAVLPAVVADRFGSRNVGSLIGILYTSVALGTLVGPAAAGWAFDVCGSYALPIAVAIGANLIAATLVALA
jgi:MFS family permease